MKRFWLLVFVFVSFNSLGSQEVKHAPTVEQCRADQRLWLAKLEESGSVGVAHVSYDELSGWSDEMLDCNDVDPEQQSRYIHVIVEVDAAQLLRLTHFLRRHHLYDQFLAEDAQGKH